MLTATVTQKGGHVEVRIVPAKATANEETTSTTVPPTEPNPILPDNSELAWTAGTFIVLLVAMRFFLYPRVRRGMDARYESIRSNRESADKVRESAQSDVAEYEKALAAARAEAAGRIDAARQTVDGERNSQLAEVNARIAAARAEAESRTAAAREAAKGEITTAVGQVASRIAEIAIGRAPDQSVVSAAVAATMEGAR